MISRKVVLCLIILFYFSSISGQTISTSLIGTSGDTFKTTDFQLDWSVGELQTDSYSGVEFKLTQGFHQGTYIISILEEAGKDAYSFRVYPNPATDYLIVEQNYPVPEFSDDLSIRIIDSNGRILNQMSFNQSKEQLNFTSFSAGTYFIKIFTEKRLIQIVKVQKI